VTSVKPHMAVLVISCDKYADLWRPFFTLLWQHWPECPFPVFLGSNTLRYADARVRSIRIGDDVGWTDGVCRMLDALPFQLVMVFLDDFLIDEPIQNAAVQKSLDCVRELELECLRLGDANLFRDRGVKAGSPIVESRPVAPWARIPGVVEYGEIVAGTPYRVSTQVSIWHVDALRAFLLPGATAWEFEEIGSQMSETMPFKFWATWDPLVKYDHAIEKGRWKQAGIEACARFGILPDLCERGTYSESELAEHFRRQQFDGRLATLRNSVFCRLRSGSRLEGLACAASLIKNFPANLTNWLIMFFAIIGPTSLQYVRTFRLRMRVRRILERSHRGEAMRATRQQSIKTSGPGG
jgi:hypothetical protein